LLKDWTNSQPGAAAMPFERFEQLDDPAFFAAFVKDHFENGWSRVAATAGSSVTTDDRLITLAYDTYGVNLRQYTVALQSQNPDQYKRGGAILHALYKASPIVSVDWDTSVRRLTDDANVGVSYWDANFWQRYTKWYEDYCNHLMSFDLAFRCCQVYEPIKKTYDKDFLDNMCYYMAENTNINVGSFVMILKAYMCDGVETPKA
jgi:hypothetical protein